MIRDHAHDDASDVLLLELTHRFFNSLQVIGSMVSMEDAEPGGSAKSRTCREYLGAVSDFYRRLSGPNPAPDDLENHCAEVCADLIRMYASKTIELSLDIEPQDLSPAGEGRLVLLIAELVTNALKHSLRQGGALSVGLSRVSAGLCELIVTDHSPSQMTRMEASPPRIASLLADSLDGRLTVCAGPRGRSVQVVISLDRRAPASPLHWVGAISTAA